MGSGQQGGLSFEGWSIPALRGGQTHPEFSQWLGQAGLVTMPSAWGPVPLSA